MKIGYIGLGKMGKNMVLRLLEQHIEVVAWNRSPEPRTEVSRVGAETVENVIGIAQKLEAPRIIWLMLPNGEPTDTILRELVPHLEKGDLVIDGGNSLYKDTVRRHAELQKYAIHFMDIGTSGGPGGARNGACLMIGGAKEDYERVLPLIKAAAAPGAYQHLGPVGAGHFAKMVHNGIEYGMMQAIAEGAAILQKSQFQYDLAQVFDIYNHRSVIESRLVEWAKEAFQEDPKLDELSSVISHTGEGQWTVDVARELAIEVPIIEQSLQVRVDSATTQENFRNKVVSALRGKFGGHLVKK